MTGPLGQVPYKRLSSFYFFYFASLGAFFPYWGLYLESLNFGPTEIGQLTAVIMGTKVVAPIVWGWIADRTDRRLGIIRLASLLAALCFSLLLWTESYGLLLAVLVGFGFFWNAALPPFEALTLNHLGSQVHRYSRIRLWGSVGFILTVVLLGELFDRSGIHWLPLAVLLLLGGGWVSTLWVPEDPARSGPVLRGNLWRVLREPAVLSLFLAFFLAQASHGPYYAFFSVYLEDHGYERDVIGFLWALGVVVEILVFGATHRWLPRYGAGTLLVMAIVVTALRWVLIGALVDHLMVLLLAQAMHAASFGLFHACAIHLVHGIFPGRLQGRGQALYSSLSFGLGGAVGSFVSGYIWIEFGPRWVYYAASLCALGAVAAAWFSQRRGRLFQSPLDESDTREMLP